MKRICTAFAIVFAFYSNFIHAAVQTIDSVVAVVDQDVVTQSELDERVSEVFHRTKAAGMQLPPEDVLRSQILELLISETLQINAARRYGVRVPDEEVLAALDNIMANQGWSLQELAANLQAEKSSVESLKRQIHRQLMMKNISEGLVSSRIKISEQDIDNFLKSADAQFWISPDYRLSHILVALPPSANQSEVQKLEAKAQGIYEKLKGGASFADQALSSSDGPLALQGGDLGWRKSTDLPTLFAEIAPTLEKGQIAPPSRSRAGFHILKLEDIRGVTKQIVNQTKARHILVKTSEIMSDEQAQNKLKELKKRIIEGEDFAVLAKEHSEDIGSKLQGGDLGWSMKGQFVPAFEKAMSQTEAGDISEPFKSEFGWHILQVQDRREEDMTKQAIRQKARNVLMSRRFEDEVQLWVQEMRDEAYIDIKI